MRLFAIASLGLLFSACGGSEVECGTTGGSGRVCPLDEVARRRAEILADVLPSDALETVFSSCAHGAPGGGGVIPFTAERYYSSVSLPAACSVAVSYDAQCDTLVPGEPPPPFTGCTQLECTGPGVSRAHTWIEGLPVTLPADPGSGDVVVRAFDSTIRCEETGELAFSLEWNNEIEVTLPDGLRLRVHVLGTTTRTDGAPPTANSSMVVTVQGLSSSPIVATFDVFHLDGEAKVDGETVAVFTSSGVIWQDPCAPPVPSADCVAADIGK